MSVARLLARRLPTDLMLDAICTAATTPEQLLVLFDRVLHELVLQKHEHNGASDDLLNSMLGAICSTATTPQQAALVFDRVLQDTVRRQHHGLFWGDRMLTLDKCADFQKEPAFCAALEDADSTTGANQYESPDGITWRYNTLIWAARECLNLPGDFVECGVYRGDMTWMITQIVDLQGAGKRFYLYDTFSGFDLKYSSPNDFPQGLEFFRRVDQEYKAPDIEDYVRCRFRDKAFVVVTKGVVPDILHNIAPERIAFLHMDMNSPSAETGALDVLFDRISIGGVVIFDDYGWWQHRKQKDAADLFVAQHNQFILELPTGQGLLVKQ
jgi:O-methyltransferase